MIVFFCAPEFLFGSLHTFTSLELIVSGRERDADKNTKENERDSISELDRMSDELRNILLTCQMHSHV